MIDRETDHPLPLDKIAAYLRAAVPTHCSMRPAWEHRHLPAYRDAIQLMVRLQISEPDWFGAWDIPDAPPQAMPGVLSEDIAAVVFNLACATGGVRFFQSGNTPIVHMAGQNVHADADNMTKNVFAALGVIRGGDWTHLAATFFCRTMPFEVLRQIDREVFFHDLTVRAQTILPEEMITKLRAISSLTSARHAQSVEAEMISRWRPGRWVSQGAAATTLAMSETAVAKAICKRVIGKL